ncbi:flagellar basal body P-ring formation chaperone FlgA [Limnobacter litoralis]|nr:flagellar basal body P-ring formation chaperone FlgA [Limnobacter litoralis]
MFTTKQEKTLGLFSNWTGRAMRLLATLCLSAPTFALATMASGQWVTQDHLAELVDPALIPKDATVQVELSKAEPRLSNGQCPAALFSNARSNRMWGRTFVQVQCVGSDQVPFFVGVDIKVWAPVLVVKQTIQPGEAIRPDEVEFRTMDLTQLQNGWVDDIARLDNKTATRQLFPGTMLRQDYFKGQPLIKVGETVKIIVKGPGFSIGGSGVAMETGEKGDVIRIKTPQGKILNGVATDPLLVEVSL